MKCIIRVIIWVPNKSVSYFLLTSKKEDFLNCIIIIMFVKAYLEQKLFAFWKHQHNINTYPNLHSSNHFCVCCIMYLLVIWTLVRGAILHYFMSGVHKMCILYFSTKSHGDLTASKVFYEMTDKICNNCEVN